MAPDPVAGDASSYLVFPYPHTGRVNSLERNGLTSEIEPSNLSELLTIAKNRYDRSPREVERRSGSIHASRPTTHPSSLSAMELNRNHYFMIGIVFLLLGMQLRTIESYVLNEPASRFVTEKMKAVSRRPTSPGKQLVAMADEVAVSQKTFQPPKWLGWAFISVGMVFVLHRLAMKRPG